LKKHPKCYKIKKSRQIIAERNGGMDMADIFEYVKKSNNSRPLYTSYELSKMVRDKRMSEGKDVQAFAAQYGISTDLLLQLEEGSCSFSPKLYKACGHILGLSSQELLSEINDDIAAANFRTDSNNDNVQVTFGLANWLFNEIIMQKKIGIK
jgi:transcriptional regulator with XRE-family HTH domain